MIIEIKIVKRIVNNNNRIEIKSKWYLNNKNSINKNK
jgi:hypothetical protein